MIEDLIFALRMFKRNKTRTILSLLGVVIGVASVIVIGTIGKSATGNVKETFGSANLAMIQVSSGFMRRSRTNSIELNEAFRQEIFSTIPNIKKIWFKNSFSATLLVEDLSVSQNIDAVEFFYLEQCGLQLGTGRYFNVSDQVEGAQNIILGSDAAAALFPDGGGAGSKISVQSSDGSSAFGFTVIGVLSGDAAGLESPKTKIYIPRGFYTKKIAPTNIASTAVVEAEDPAYVTRITADLKALAALKTGDSYALNVNSMQAMLEQYDEVTGTMNLMLSGIAAISLLVGGIGIMNIMIVTVTERKKEIGIRKAIGASPLAIRTQFLVESAAITVLGGVLGISIGIGISAAAVALLKWSFTVDWSACAVAFIFSAFVGVFFGFYPASQAAKLDPVTALSSE
ncbi:MAG: ABC transporter permease [Spirochaetaceae bacterium]|jgi:putative ABC transport system permease protein|nr:ABC transporter permease [Spirochaetaceae bacterium]